MNKLSHYFSINFFFISFITVQLSSKDLIAFLYLTFLRLLIQIFLFPSTKSASFLLSLFSSSYKNPNPEIFPAFHYPSYTLFFSFTNSVWLPCPFFTFFLNVPYEYDSHLSRTVLYSTRID